MNRSTVFKQAKSFLIVSHYHPDGDALGSSLALAIGLKSLGKKVVVYNRDPVPYNLAFLPQTKLVTQKIPAGKFDCAVMVDCAQPKRVSDEFAGALEQKRFGTLLCIDHHLLDHPIGDIDWIDAKQPSTGCVIWKILKQLKVKRTKDIANLVFCTLVVDTGSFRYSNTTATSFRLAAELLDLGADPWLISRNIEESDPLERFRLMELCLKTLTLAERGLFASMDITQAALREAKATSDMAEEFSTIPRSIRGVEVAALFREMEDGRVKVSLRSKLKVDVSKIAKEFGGGGHKHAAGCFAPGPFAQGKKKIQAAVAKAL